MVCEDAGNSRQPTPLCATPNTVPLERDEVYKWCVRLYATTRTRGLFLTTITSNHHLFIKSFDFYKISPREKKKKDKIMDSTTTIDVSTYDNQLQCPLFGTLPGEIRNEIFALALVQFSEEEGGAAYPKDSYWYRPGFTGPRKSSSSLLRACKLAYVEGQKVFLRELEWAFWFGMLYFLV